MVISSATAQNATRGAEATKNDNFINSFYLNQYSKGITTTEEDELSAEVETIQNTINHFTTAVNMPGNYGAGKAATSDYNPVLKHAVATNRVCQSQPINIRKTVIIEQ